MDSPFFLVELLVDILEALFEDKKEDNNISRVMPLSFDSNASREAYLTKDQLLDHQGKIDNLEFQTLLLSYMMNEDDGRISLRERSTIIDNFDSYRNILEKDDIKRIKKLINRKVTLEFVVNHCRKENLNEKEINKGIHLLEIIDEDSNRYHHIISGIKRRFVNEVEYR